MVQMNKTDFSELRAIEANATSITNTTNTINSMIASTKDVIIAHYQEVHLDDKVGVRAMAENLKANLDAQSAELQTLITSAGG